MDNNYNLSADEIRGKRRERTDELMRIEGHPLNTFAVENRALERIVAECRAQAENGSVSHGLMEELRQLSVHYAKKGDLLYPHLKVKYNISGPSGILWTTDDEIRKELSYLSENENKQDEGWINRLKDILIRVEKMIYKENNVLFPNCAVNFTEGDWIGIYRDSKDYEVCFDMPEAVWEKAEEALKEKTVLNSNSAEITMPGGHMSVRQLAAMLNTIPLEITFVDEHDINRYFNEGHKVFKRPQMAVDREVFSCHPPKIEEQVRRIIAELKAGKLDKVPIWMEKNGKTMLVTYMAVREDDGNYLGTMEIVQDMEFAKEHFLR